MLFADERYTNTIPAHCRISFTNFACNNCHNHIECMDIFTIFPNKINDATSNNESRICFTILLNKKDRGGQQKKTRVREKEIDADSWC